MLREVENTGSSGGSDALSEATALRGIRDQLQAFEESRLARIAETLARTTEAIERNIDRLDRLEDEILTPRRAAAALGYVDEESGDIMVEAFEKMSAKNGLPRCKLSARRFVYVRTELIEAIKRLPR